MKKFLTVLLVIAVMFTFSFGSAFAATTTYTADEVVAAMQTEANDYVTLIAAQGTQYIKGGSYPYPADEAAVKVVVDEVVQDQQEAFLAEVVKLQAAIKGTYTADERTAAIQSVAALYNNSFVNCINANVSALALSIEQYAIEKAEAEAKLAEYDASKYSDSTKDDDLIVITATQAQYSDGKLTAGEKASKREVVEAVLDWAAAKFEASAVSEDATTGVDDNSKEIRKFGMWLGYVEEALKGIPTLEDEAEDAKTEEENMLYNTAIMEGELALAEAKVRKVLNDELAALKKATKVDEEAVEEVEKELAALAEQYDAAKEVLAAYIEAGIAVSTSHLACDTYAGFAPVEVELQKCVERAADVEKFEAYASVLANVTDAAGAAIYDAEEVAEITEDVVADIYQGKTTYAAAAKAETFEAAKVAAAADLSQKKAAIDEVKAYKNAENYDEAQAEELQTIIDAAVEDIMAAATKADIDDIVKAAKKNLDTVVDKTQHAKDWKTTGKLGKEFAKTYQNELAGYADYAQAKLPAKGYDAAKAALITPAVSYANIPAFAMDIVKEAYTVEEIAAKVVEAKAAIDSLMSDAELDAAADAVEALISQIKVPVTLEQKDVVLAANDAVEEYLENVGADAADISNKALLDAAKNTLGALVLDDLKDQYDALVKADLTAADEATVEAFEEAVEEYNETFGGKYAPNVDALKEEVKDAKFADVVAAMVAIPADPGVADKATVEAARAAYEALTLEEKVDFGADKLNSLYLDKLISAEAAVAAEEIVAVEALKITAGSSAKKGSITVKWTVKGEKAAVQGWEIWKSTKKNSGYKKAFTQVAEKQTYKNTKGLKKGTRYYYKVRAIAYTADGTKIKSDWSNKAYRIAK